MLGQIMRELTIWKEKYDHLLYKYERLNDAYILKQKECDQLTHILLTQPVQMMVVDKENNKFIGGVENEK